jgi:hypothetical protein
MHAQTSPCRPLPRWCHSLPRQRLAVVTATALAGHGAANPCPPTLHTTNPLRPLPLPLLHAPCPTASALPCPHHPRSHSPSHQPQDAASRAAGTGTARAQRRAQPRAAAHAAGERRAHCQQEQPQAAGTATGSRLCERPWQRQGQRGCGRGKGSSAGSQSGGERARPIPPACPPRAHEQPLVRARRRPHATVAARSSPCCGCALALLRLCPSPCCDRAKPPAAAVPSPVRDRARTRLCPHAAVPAPCIDA